MDVDPSPQPLHLPPDLRAEVEKYTGPLPSSSTRLSILRSHLSALPNPLARSLGSPLSPRQRTIIPKIKHRRHTLEYDPIDFMSVDDDIAEQDAEDAWFDDEVPSAGGGASGNGADSGSKAMENGQGEYDY
ncbi:hypothetical protein CcaverHIS002_0109700 [Cutaneotrichosporon cavernicola]|nr:hypothetical protein CcaverHIS002_0109700 [Cutaneotrichosporon cavernicola]BEI96016.1 hypothetical protein CcaverHIS631_0109650 [Cutaneotrichosporon cavernicola]